MDFLATSESGSWNVKLTLFTQWRSSTIPVVSEQGIVDEINTRTGVVEMFALEDMSEMAATSGACNLNPGHTP